MERIVYVSLHPAVVNKKGEGGRMLDPTYPKSVQVMMDMLKSLSGQVWRPVKSLIGKALDASLEFPAAFLRITKDEEEKLHKYVVESNVTCVDIANLCTLLLLSFSFQRSQVLREATMDEFSLAPDLTRYKFTFTGRRFKTVSSSGSLSAPRVSHFMLTPDQSMIIKFLGAVGHKFCNLQSLGEERRLFFNMKGQSWTQKDALSRLIKLGCQWLGIEAFGIHVCRSFWTCNALNSGQIGSQKIEEFSGFLQVSSNTLRNSYMSASANTAAHIVGNEVLGAVTNMACIGETTGRGNRPYGRRLSVRRNEFIGGIQASLAAHDGSTMDLFGDLLRKRNGSQLLEGETWFRWENTFFDEGDERLFLRVVETINV